MSRIPGVFGEGRARGVAMVAASAVGQGIAAGLIAYETREIFFALHSGPGAIPISSLLLLFLGGVAIAVLRVLGRVAAESVGQDFAIALRHVLFAHLASLPAGVVANRRSGALALRFVGDLGTARHWAGLGVAQIISALIVVPAATVVLWLLNPSLAAAASLPILLCVLFMLALAPRLEPLHRELRKRRANLAIDAMERVSVAPELTIIGRARKELETLNRRGAELRQASVRRIFAMTALKSLPDLGLAAAAAALLWVAFTSAAAPAEAAAALAVIGILVQPLRDLAGVWDRRCAWRIARGKIEALLASPGLTLPSGKAGEGSDAPAQIAYRLVGAGVLRDFTAAAAPGEKIAVFGPNGAGKSTCLALAAGLEEPAEGCVTIDGVDLRDLPLGERQQRLVYVGPRSPILRGSLRRALTLGISPRPDDSRIEVVARDFGLGLVLERLGGLDGRISANGRNLSEGEARRVQLIRAALAKPALLLIDDVDGALDSAGRETLTKLLRDTAATVLLATRDPAFARTADQIWVLSNGSLIAQGPPEATLAGSGAQTYNGGVRAVA